MSLSTAQRSLVAHFRDLTQCSDATAQKYLRATRFNVESALDAFLRKHAGSNGPSKQETAKLNEIFDSYMESTEDASSPDTQSRKATKTTKPIKAPKDDDVMQIEGTMRYLTDLGLDLEKAPVLAICMLLGAPTQGQFTRKPWLEGWRSLNITQLQGMRDYAASLDKTLSCGTDSYDEALFKKTYLFTYGFALTPPARTLELDTALAFWDVLYLGTNQPFALYPRWRAFCESKTRGISRDVWNMTYDFSRTVSADLADYDEMEAWPVLIDEFVAHCKQQA